MARRYNDLFIGAQHLNIEGREIKHPALIKLYATLNLNKTSETPIGLIGIDLETNHLTAELKLLGFYDGTQYAYYTENFISILFTWVKHASRESKALAYWNKLDPFVIYKQFLYLMDDKERKLSMSKFGKVSGEWNKEEAKWDIKPLCEVKFGDMYFGIRNVIRSSIQFYFRREYDTDIKMIWAYDIAGMFQNGLEAEALKRLPYYSKVDKSAHLVDWDKFTTDKHYRENIVLKSNELDARAVHDLGLQIQEEFKEAFGYYPKNLISQGSLARSAVVATISNIHNEDREKTADDVKSIGIINYLDTWSDKFGKETVKDLLCLMFESYSGGQIEAYAYGFTEEAFMTDLTQAYPYHIQNLYDLRGSTIVKGSGEPTLKDYTYTLIRGDVSIPYGVDYHPLTIKHPYHQETNIRAVGEYRASYTIEEREFLKDLGATFSNEEWYDIITSGKLSPLAKACKVFTDLRAKLRPMGKDYVAKTASASLYGILFEAVDTWVEIGDEVFRDGYRGGEFLNPLYATIITSRTRIQVSRALNEVKRLGGKPILAMTDSVFYTGTADMIPSDMIKDVKTVGYFEPVERVKDLVSLGSGRYSYKALNKKTGVFETMVAKKRGLNATELHNPDGIAYDEFNWYDALSIMKQTGLDHIDVSVRSLISVGMVNHNHSYTYKDLGKVITDTKNVDAIVGRMKRIYDDDLKDASILAKQLVETEPIHLSQGMFGNNKLHNQTLPELRRLLMQKDFKTAKERRREVNTKAVNKYATNGKTKKNRNYNYQALKEYGYKSKERVKMQSWSIERIKQKLMEDGKI